MKRPSLLPVLLVLCFTLIVSSSTKAQLNDWPMHYVTWDILDCPQFPQYDYWERNCLIKTAEPSGEILIPQGGVDGLNLEKPMWITIPENRPTWAIAIAHAWNLHRNFIQKYDFPKIGYYMAITGHETGMACDCDAEFSDGHLPWSTTGLGELNWPSKCGDGARSDDGCFQMEYYNAWGELNQIFPHRFPCNNFHEVISGDVFETQAIALSYRNIGYSLLMEYSWNMNPWPIFENPNCDPYAYEKFLAASWNGSISGTYATLTQSNTPGEPFYEPDPARQKSNPVNFFEHRNNTANNPNWDLDGTVAYYPEVIAWSMAAIEGDTAYAGYRYRPGDYTSAQISTGLGQAGEIDYLGQPIPAGQPLPMNTVNGTHAELQNHVQLGYYNGDIYWADVDYYIDRMLPFYFEYNDPTLLAEVKVNVKTVFESISGSEFNPIPFRQLGPVVDEIILSFPKENPLVAMLQLDGVPNGPSGSGQSTCTGQYAPASHIKPVNIQTDTMCTDQTLILEADVVGGDEPNMTYTWYLDGAPYLTGVNEDQVTFTPLTPGEHSFDLLVCNQAGGCSMAACTYQISVKECSACNLAAQVTTVNTPCSNTEGGSMTLQVTGSSNYTVFYDGPLMGSQSFTTGTATIDELLDGIYNIRVQDNNDPNCFFLTSEEIGYDFYMNDVVEASVVEVRDCETEITAEIVKSECQCPYTVYAEAVIANRWERFVTMEITPSNGRFEIFRGDVFGNNNGPNARTFMLCTGESIHGELQIIPASGSCDTNRTDAVNVQLEDYNVWVEDPDGNEVFRTTVVAGTATQDADYVMFDITIDCPYSSPFDYTYHWDPSDKTTQTIVEQQGNNQDIMYTVTATNIQHPQCIVRDSILVPFQCSTGCTDPGTVTLTPSSGLEVCGTSQTLTASTSTTAPTGGFLYEFFFDNGSGAVSLGSASGMDQITATQSGSYYVVVTDPANPSTCSGQSSPITINYYEAPTVADAGSNESICEDHSQLNANTPTVGVGQWSVVSGVAVIGDASDPLTAVTDLGSGTNSFEWTITNGVCPPSSALVEIEVQSGNAVSDAGADQDICATSATLAAQGTGTWNVLSGSGTLQDPTSATSAISNLSAGVIELEWVVTDGACSVDRDTVVITRSVEPSTANAGQDQQLCTTTTFLEGNAPSEGTGQWSIVSGTGTMADDSDPVSAISNMAAGTIILEWTISSGVCTPSTDQVEITVEQGNAVAIAGADQEVCATETTLDAQGQGVWNVLTGGGTLNDHTNPTTTISDLVAGVTQLEWVVTDGSCSEDRDTVEVTRHEEPSVADAGVDQENCGLQTTLEGVVPTVGQGQWTVLSGNGTIQDVNDEQSVLSVSGNDTVTLQWEVTNGNCSASSDEVVIQFSEESSVAVVMNGTTLCADEVELSATAPTSGTGSWSVISGNAALQNAADAQATATSLAVGENVFEWSVENGSCPASTAQVTITRDEEPSLADAGDDQTICGSQAVLSAVSPNVGTGSWSLISGGGIIASTSTPLTNVTDVQTGVNTYEWTVTNGVCSVNSDQVTITGTLNATAEVSLAPTPFPVLCAGEDLEVQAVPVNGGVNPVYEWFIDGVSQGTTNQATLSLSAPVNGTTVSVSMISDLGCAIGSPAMSETRTLEIDAHPSAAVAGEDQNVCASLTQLTANSPSVGVGTWSVVAGSGNFVDLADPETFVSDLGEGNNVFQWEITNGGCQPAVSQVTIFKSGNLTTPDAGEDVTVCENVGDLQLEAIEPGTQEQGMWSVVQGSAVISDVTVEDAIVGSLSPGVHILRWTLSNGVCPDAFDDVQITVEAAPELSNAGIDQVICDSVAALDGNSPTSGNGAWTLISGDASIDDPTDPRTAILLRTNEATFLWSITTGGACSQTTDEIVVTSTGTVPALVTLEPSEDTVCTGEGITYETIVFNGGTSPSYVWYLNGAAVGNGEVFDLPVPAEGDIVSVEVTSSLPCAAPSKGSDIHAPVVVQPQVPEILSSDQSLCEDQQGVLVGNDENLNWFQNGTFVSSGSSVILDGDAEGNWIATLDNGVCPEVSSNLVQVAVYTIPQVDAGADIEVFVGEPVLLEGSSDASEVAWTPSNTLASPDQPLTNAELSESGLYEFTLTATNGPCLATDVVEVLVQQPVTIPNTFSPNGDGINDAWVIKGLETKENIDIAIFNRWGSEVYHGYSLDYWTGTSKGEKLPAATYYYVVMADGETFNGDVTIIR